jgi:hypothetical protein
VKDKGIIVKRLTNISQLKVGMKLKIVAQSKSDCYNSVSVKQIIMMRRWDGEAWSEPYDYEILLNRKKNYYFSMLNYIGGKSNWVKEVYILDGVDKRLKEAREEKFLCQ